MRERVTKRAESGGKREEEETKLSMESFERQSNWVIRTGRHQMSGQWL